MDVIWIFLVLAVTVEAVVEYGKSVTSESRKEMVSQFIAIGVAVALCIFAGVDIYAALGITFGGLPIVGSVLTGIFASRGANYASDLLSKLNGIKNAA